MSQIAEHKPFSVITIGLALVVAVFSASAQDTSGKSILLEAVEAARNLKALRAEVELSGADGGIVQAYIPTGKGTLTLVRQAEAVDGRAWHTRLETTYTHTQKDNQEHLSSLRTPTAFIWVDHAAKAVHERAHDERKAQASTRTELFVLPELTSEEPFSRELREAVSWKKLDRKKANGSLCDVVEIRYDMSKVPSKSTSLIRTPVSRWYFGVDDHLPRRLERITDEGMLSFTIVLDIRNLEINPEIDPASLAIKTPEGYTRTQKARQISAEQRNEALQQEIDAAERNEGPPRHPDQLPAHGFELVDGEGNEVSLESLKGNVAVLYFWGSWCGTCKGYSPLVSDLVDKFEGEPVKVFGLAVRERSEEAVREVMSQYKHTLLLNPGKETVGCDATARAYKVRRFPTIYVVGFDSEVLTIQQTTPGVEPAEMMEQITETIRDYLDSKN